ncbi:Hypothetical protein R9X50_00649600 [Acrodontium crateriforme]|uniref:DNA damage-responsive protein 48 n=1 Tax=Acrodontium crateriforme TaxID=150365 RepID=A0AAQ3RDM8_9PEZI|nr:Hypothetical protein R9X50_00649600 [Acrodontium crateriforme]
MDFIKNALNNNNNHNNGGENSQGGGNPFGGNAHGGNSFNGGNPQASGQSSGQGNFLSGLTDKLNGAVGGGRESEKNEDYLDKGIDFVQEKFLGQGPQDNETAVEQAKDEQISDFIRAKYKATTGSDFPIKDKPTAMDRFT